MSAACRSYLVLGETGSAKTSVVLHSGLEPELLAGQTVQDKVPVPTRTANLWYTRQFIFAEAGGPMLQDRPRWARLVKKLAPRQLHSVFGKGTPAPRVLPRATPLPAASKGERRNRFGFFAQLVDAKGLHVLLEAVTLLRAGGFTDFAVEINGDNIHFATPKRREEIEAFLAAEEKLPLAERNVVLNGSYHHDQLRARMARVDWVVVPSVWWEIFCLVISEAWSYGRPVIASNAGGPAERVSDGVDGLLFELGDARALADTMYRACTEEGLWETLAEGITPPPSRAEMVEGFLQVYAADRVVKCLAAV